eukprot:2891639-Lingulodinium_polyedra.AAC.1
MLKDYRAVSELANAGGRSEKWILMVFKEDITAVSELEMKDGGMMMGQDKWIERSQTAGVE